MIMLKIFLIILKPFSEHIPIILFYDSNMIGMTTNNKITENYIKCFNIVLSVVNVLDDYDFDKHSLLTNLCLLTICVHVCELNFFDPLFCVSTL